jgi:predicted TIM-barrel fold metal-dependent hydrolase
VVLEETFDNTVRFIRELAPGLRVIIPHLGGLNGGFEAIAAAGLWELETVWSDTALASRREIEHYLQRYGHSRLMFGSDFPFGDPARELEKIRAMHLDPKVTAAVLKENFIRLQAGAVRSNNQFK